METTYSVFGLVRELKMDPDKIAKLLLNTVFAGKNAEYLGKGIIKVKHGKE